MNRRSTSILVPFVVVLLLSSLLAPSVLAAGDVQSSVDEPNAAQFAGLSGDGDVLLDTSRNRLGRVSVQGDQYVVYSYDNYLPYAEGIEVYSNGQRVTSETRARGAVRVIAWQRAARQLSGRDIETLKQIDASATRINGVVTPPLNALNTVLNIVDELKRRQFLGKSYWAYTTDASPTLAQLEVAARTSRNELQEWKTAAEGVNNNVPVVVTELERMDRGEDVDYNRLSQRFAASMVAIERLQGKSIEVRDGLVRTAQMASTVSADVKSVPVIGGDLSRGFADLSRTLGDSANTVDTYAKNLDRQHDRLARVKRTAESQEAGMMNSWQARQTAEIKVYATIGVAGILALLLIVALLGRRRG